MKLSSSLVALSIVRCAVAGDVYSSEDFERSGNFEIEHGWSKLTAKFDSGENETVVLNFKSFALSQGNVWFDDFECSPDLGLTNAGFESGNDGWTLLNCSVDESKACEGSRAVHFSIPLESEPERILRRVLKVKPNTRYEMSFRMCVGDDFQGNCELGVFDGKTWSHLVLTNFSDDLQDYAAHRVAERERNGRRAMKLGDGESALLDLPVPLPEADMNVCASLDVKADGPFHLHLVGDDGGRIASKTVAGNGTWTNFVVNCRVPVKNARLALAVGPNGRALVDNVLVTSPRMCPPAREAKWGNAADDFIVPEVVRVRCEGKVGRLVENALGLLADDLRAVGKKMERVDEGEADVRISTGAGGCAAGYGPDAYSLAINRRGVDIRAFDPRGAMYGVMSVLDLLGQFETRIPAVTMRDWPDLALRGFIPSEQVPERLVRRKLNCAFYNVGFPETDVQWRDAKKLAERYRDFGIGIVAFNGMSFQSQFVLSKNPSLGCGAYAEERLTLAGAVPTALSRPKVIRTALSDVRARSGGDEPRTYRLGADYTVSSDSQGRCWIARTAESAIADGQEVIVGYDAWRHERPPYCMLEPEVRQYYGDFFERFLKELPISNVHPHYCTLEMQWAIDAMKDDSRIVASGKDAITLLTEDLVATIPMLRRTRPNAKVWFFAGEVNEFSRRAAPILAAHGDGLVAVVWGYDVNWVKNYGAEAIKFWSDLGITTVTMPWDNPKNVRDMAHLAYDAARSGQSAIGMIGSSWFNRPGDIRAVASACWAAGGSAGRSIATRDMSDGGNAAENEVHLRNDDSTGL